MLMTRENVGKRTVPSWKKTNRSEQSFIKIIYLSTQHGFSSYRPKRKGKIQVWLIQFHIDHKT
jgi:hypothetical protein